MLLLAVFLLVGAFFVDSADGLTDCERYAQLNASIVALQANPTPSHLAQIRLIQSSTDYLRLKALCA